MCPTGRLQLVLDVVLARVLDDATFSTFNSLYYFNTVALVTDLQADKKYKDKVVFRVYLMDIFRVNLISDASTSLEQRSLALAFLQELCDMTKNFQPSQRKQFFE